MTLPKKTRFQISNQEKKNCDKSNLLGFKDLGLNV